MQFRTELILSPSNQFIDYNSNVFLIGSCFANMLSEKLEQNKINHLSNPFGILFNPVSIHSCIINSCLNLYTPRSVKSEDYWFDYQYHSEITDELEENLQLKINKRLEVAHYFIHKTNYIIITWGTAVVHELKSDKFIVGNCHKIPSSQFSKRVLSLTEIMDSFDKTMQILNEINPNLKIILTVSPVRHLKEGLELNSASKSLLRYCAFLINEKYSNVEYFPSFEILMDDLRDYRFYESDMLHPNSVAEDYVWNKFKLTYFSINFQELVSKWNKVLLSIHHKPFKPTSKSYIKHLEDTIKQLKEFESVWSIDKEMSLLQERLKNAIN